MSIPGTRGAIGKKTRNSGTYFNALFDEVVDQNIENELDEIKLESFVVAGPCSAETEEQVLKIRERIELNYLTDIDEEVRKMKTLKLWYKDEMHLLNQQLIQMVLK